MPESLASAREKPIVWKVIEKKLGSLTTPNTRRRDWRVTADGKTSIFVTYSKYYESSDRWWYGLDPEDLRRWLRYSQAFIDFVVGNGQETLVIPIDRLHLQIQRSKLKLDNKTGHFKLHLIPSIDRNRFRELKSFEISHYFRNISLLASK